MKKNCKIVLVRPRDPNNIGAAARAMKNFGFNELVVVAPYPPVWAETVSAVKSEDLLANARVVENLAEAIDDCTLVVGTTDRTRIEQKQNIFLPSDLSRELVETNHRVALVFGQEKHGLTNEDLSYCHRILSIPTQLECPSMNLGQAVAICCYEIVRQWDDYPIPRPAEVTTAGAVERVLQLTLEVLGAIDFIIPANEEMLKAELRSKLLNYNLSESDAGMLCSMLRRIKNGLR
ncbi:MAG: TrmJ/YjtD family RNA methyltransferase [Acidobacteria bacterium]|nr:TrmJ/YjtD family RNA methyltransferase [Acidobacteriota bacterium]